MDQRLTNQEVRVANVKRVLFALLRQGAMTLQELALRLELSHATVSGIIKELTEQGIVARGAPAQSMSGRPPAYLSLVPEARYAAGLSVSPETVRMVLLNLNLQIVASRSHTRKLEHTPAYWQNVSDQLEGFLTGVPPDKLLGANLSIPVPLVGGTKVALTAGTRKDAHWDIEQTKRYFSREISAYNNAKMAAFSQIFGAGEQSDAVYLMLSAGVGGAIIADGRIMGTERKNAEFGHMTVQDGGRLCTCGQKGCLGSYCSSSALRQRAGVDLDTFFQELSGGNAAFAALWEEYLHYLAIGVNNLRLLFDTDIIIGGEMSKYLIDYQQDFKERLSCRNAFAESGDYLRIGQYGALDAAIGGAMLAMLPFFL